jgi:hypothetical protein
MLCSPSPQQDCVNAWNSPFNSCARYIYGIFTLWAHIELHQQNLGRSIGRVIQHEDMLHDQQKIKSGGLRYMFDKLRFGQSSRLFNLLVPAHSLNARACSFFVQGTILWNDLPPAVKRGGSMGKFRVECLSHLGRSASLEASKVSVFKNEIKMKMKWKWNENKYFTKLFKFYFNFFLG